MRGVGLLEAVSPVALPASDKVQVIALRRQMAGDKPGSDRNESRVDAASVREWEPELRKLYLDLSAQALYPVKPELTTPEGDPLEFHKLIYDLDSPQRAFDAFAKLAVMADDPVAMERTLTRDRDGAVHTAAFDLARPGQDPGARSVSLLGRVRIEPHRLTVEVNSRERAEWIKDNLVPAALGTATPRGLDEVQTLDQLLADPRRSPHKPTRPSVDDPEAIPLLADALRSHYDQWIDTPLPALDGRTPRVVATSGDGREQVAALLDSAEAIDAGVPADVRKAIFASIRVQLHLQNLNPRTTGCGAETG